MKKRIDSNKNSMAKNKKEIDEELKRLYRSEKNKVIAGVCGGMGEYFNIDPVWIRLLFILFTLIYFSGIFLYVIAWLIIPKKR